MGELCSICRTWVKTGVDLSLLLESLPGICREKFPILYQVEIKLEGRVVVLAAY